MKVMQRITRVLASAIVGTFMVVSAAIAQQVPSVTAFLADPARLLEQNPQGGSLLASTVEQIALTDTSTFEALLGLLPRSNEAQRGAIGRGLAHAAKVLVLTNQEVAVAWQQQIALVTDPSFNTAATEALADVKLGSVGGGPGSGLGGPGGGPGGGVAEDIRPKSFGTLPFTITGSTTASGSTTSPTNPSSFTGFNPVSASVPQ
jgi:hypothetical protein